MTAAMRRLLARCLLETRRLVAALDDGMDVAAWRDAFAATLARYHMAAQVIGQGGGGLAPDARRALTKAGGPGESTPPCVPPCEGGGTGGLAAPYCVRVKREIC